MHYLLRLLGLGIEFALNCTLTERGHLELYIHLLSIKYKVLPEVYNSNQFYLPVFLYYHIYTLKISNQMHFSKLLNNFYTFNCHLCITILQFIFTFKYFGLYYWIRDRVNKWCYRLTSMNNSNRISDQNTGHKVKKHI